MATTAQEVSAPAARKGRRWLRLREHVAGYSFILPAIALIAVFLLYPIGYVVYLSFFRWDLLGSPTFIGSLNYYRLFHSDEFISAIWHTLYFVILAVPTQMVLGLFLAVLLNRAFIGRRWFRTIFFIPMAMSFVAAGLAFRYIFAISPIQGFIPDLLHGHFPDWEGTAGNWAMPMIVLMNTWKSTGYAMIVYLAGLQGISPDLYEAAAVDGVKSEWQRFRYVSWPLLAPTTWLLIITTTIFTFRAFDPIYVMTYGGPADATETIVFYGYQQYTNQTGLASAAYTVLLIGVLAIAIMQFGITRRGEQ
jgi:multiple sugar transport system permease protein